MNVIAKSQMSEWKRIVANMDEMMAVCDRLEKGIESSMSHADRLMESVVGQLGV